MKTFTRILCITSVLLNCVQYLAGQVSFTNANTELSTLTHSGCPLAVADINGDGFDDIIRLDQAHSLYIDYQRPGQSFDSYFIGDFASFSEWAWAMCVADVDHNGYKDIIAGGYGPTVKIMKLDNTGTAGTIYDLPFSDFFLQNTNFADINNDGWEDVFGCDDNAENHIWLNDGTGNFIVSGIIDFNVTNTDDSGNYGSVWTDFDNDHDLDLFVAKCRQTINDPADGRRIDVLFVNDGSNDFEEDAAAYGLNDSGQTWTTNFADIDNDGDLDAISNNHDIPCKLLENDGTGHFTNITAGSGFEVDVIPIESIMEDFDNDGFVDILIAGTDYQFFHNNGSHTFTEQAGIFDNNHLESFAVGDLNHDGKIDVFGCYATLYTTPTSVDDVYWLNTTENENHFITLNLKGTESNVTALGARAEVYGIWGTQIREVRAGESYGTCNSFNLHFGLGTSTEIDSIVLRWPSGIITKIINPAVDQFLTVIEDECISVDNTISSSGSLTFCTGESVTLTASDVPPGYTYSWSNGESTQSIVVTISGKYFCTISSPGNECSSTSPIVSVIQNPDETPVIIASGSLDLCEGNSVELTGPQSDSYLWSNGATTQSITVTEAGTYTLTIEGICQSWTSEPAEVDVLASPSPTTNDVYLSAAGSATLEATGNSISWYSVPTGGSPVATGSSFVTPYLEYTKTYYAEDAYSYNADTMYTGQISHEGTLYSASSSTNSNIIFDVINPCFLKSVKVYTDKPGNRLIELKDNDGNVVESAMINIPADSSRITLDFNLEPGNGYQLTTNSNQNNILLGYDSPRLQRSNQGVDYPYIIEDLVSLNNSDQGSEYYYYFYDWEVQTLPTVCKSDRSPATVYITTGVDGIANANSFELFPNPTDGMIFILSGTAESQAIDLRIIDVAGNTVSYLGEKMLTHNESIQLDLGNLESGMYFLQIRNNSINMCYKLAVQ